MKGAGKKSSGVLWRTKVRTFRGIERLWIPRTVLDVRSNRTQIGSVSMASRCASRRKMPTAEEVEDNLSQRRTEMSEECGSLGYGGDRGGRRRHQPPRGADPSTGHVKINAMNSVKFVMDDATGSVKFVKIVMTGSSRVRSERRANIWRRQKGTTSVKWSNKFDVLNLTESGLEQQGGERS